MVSDDRKETIMLTRNVSIRFEVRGGFRHPLKIFIAIMTVSIRFEVRGGFRLSLTKGTTLTDPFQSALRFAVVSDGRSQMGHRAGGGFNPL